jgi:hypothetical protein
MLRRKTTANIGFYASWAEGITISICPLLYLGSGRRMSINFSSYHQLLLTLPSSGYRQTEY